MKNRRKKSQWPKIFQVICDHGGDYDIYISYTATKGKKIYFFLMRNKI